ncbi:hypothetical protein AOCH_006457 [Aspergillus ochraceoroseus]|nr:hypothetical protein AOCH_006457 [Aspergillus ochraceoroseus]
MGAYSGLGLLAFFCFAQWASCRVVRFHLTLTWEDREVAGVVRKVILSNGQFPGPTLRLKQYDDVEFLVTNAMPFATTVHFHGIAQLGTPWSDGVPGLSQDLIQPGGWFLYEWTAADYGSYAYHSHSRAQLIDGLYGAIYVEPDKSVEKPFALITTDPLELAAMVKAEARTQPLLVSDWRFLISETILRAEEESGCEDLCSNAVLINGKGSAWCLPQERIDSLATFGQRILLGNYTLTDLGCFPPVDAILGTFPRNPSVLPKGFVEGCTPGNGPTEIIEANPLLGYISFDVISMAGAAIIMFSIDEHPMYIYAIDGRYVEPIRVEAVEIPTGARYSVLVKLDQLAGNYTIRAANTGVNQVINGTGIMSYTSRAVARKKSSRAYITEVGNGTSPDVVFLNESLVVPFPVELPATTVDQTVILNIDHYHASYRWSLGNSSYSLRYETLEPALFNRSTIPYENHVTTLNGTWIDIVFNLTSGNQPPHPMHKHSNKYFVIGSGNTPFTYSSVAEAMEVIPENFNFDHPQMRDTFSTMAAEGPLGTWLAVRYHVINPGPFLLHCHLEMHLSGGMAIALLDGVDAWPTVPPKYQLSVSKHLRNRSEVRSDGFDP